MSIRTASVFLIYLTLSANALQCVNEKGDAVDWIYSYKLPLSKNSENDLMKKGVAYVYMTSTEPTWTLSKLGVDEDNSLLALHVKLYLERKDKISFLAYNDILPAPLHGKESKTAGHAKGLILADMDGGVWTTGTLSGFPGPENKYKYPESGKMNGEFFTCVSMDLKNLDEAGTALAYREAQIYASKLTPGMESSLPKLLSVSKDKKSNSAPWYQVEKLKSRAGSSLMIFSKSKEFGGDLYKDLVAANLKNDILVRSSVTKKDGLSSNCTGAQKVKNIQSASIKVAGVTISNDEDDAKWAIAESSTGEGWICVGDMDRNESEKHRGGGATCLSNKDIANIFKESITSTEECP